MFLILPRKQWKKLEILYPGLDFFTKWIHIKWRVQLSVFEFRKCIRTQANQLERELKMSEVADKVKKIVVEQLGVSEEQVTPEAKFIEDLGADSLDQVELVMALEEAFGSDIPDEDAEKLTTVGDAIKYVESKTQE